MVITEEQKKLFWSNVSIGSEDECWDWKLCKSHNGYGRVTINYITQRTHRISWILTNGTIPDGLCVLHRCDNPACCNPSHLFLGDVKDNTCDKCIKDRQLKGEDAGMAKLTDEDVINIRDLYNSYMRISHIARMYNMSEGAIAGIVKNRKWKHLL
jgi:hypothetical protein